MAFVAQCPFCKVRAKLPDRANGAIGRCPKCGSSFTLAPIDDQRLPEPADEPDAEPEAVPDVSAAIALAAASVEEPPAPSTSLAQSEARPPARLQPAAVLGAVAFFLSGLALVFASIGLLHGFVIPLSAVALAVGVGAIVMARLSRPARLLLPIAGAFAGAAVLGVVLFLPALFGPAFAYRPKPRDPPAAGLHAIPLAGAPAMPDVPEWVDASRYALQRDGLRVQVIHLTRVRQDAKDKPVRELLLVKVRVSQHRPDGKLARKDEPRPLLRDEAGQAYALRETEFFERGDGKSKDSLFAVPTVEETFAFDAPAKDVTLHLEMPAERWSGGGAFGFSIRQVAQGMPNAGPR